MNKNLFYPREDISTGFSNVFFTTVTLFIIDPSTCRDVKNCPKSIILNELRLLDIGQFLLISSKFNGPLLIVARNSLLVTFNAQRENLLQKSLIVFFVNFLCSNI